MAHGRCARDRGLYARTALALLLIIGIAGWAAARDEPVDVVIVLDSSGSMARNDPDFLRIPAAHMLIRLLRDGDRAAVVSFSDQAWPIRRLTDTGPEANRDDLAESVHQVSNRGALTHLYAALKGSMALFEDISSADPDRRRILVFMTDGVMDTGDSADDELYSQRLVDELGPALQQQAIELHSIAFTLESDLQLLNALAERAAGEAHLALTAEDLPPVFKRIFETIKQPDALPIRQQTFLVDDAVREVTLVVPSTQATLSLVSPQGQRYSAEDISDNMRWYHNPAYDMVTIQRPSPGQWQLQTEAADRSQAYILTDIQLQVDWPQAMTAGADHTLSAWLSDADEVISSQNALSPFRFSLRLVQGPDLSQSSPPSQNLQGPDGRGQYHAQWQASGAGEHVLDIVARAPTLERSRRLYLDIAETATAAPRLEPVETEPSPEPPEASEETATAPQPSSEPTAPSATTPETGTWQAWLLRGSLFLIINALLIVGIIFWLKRSGGDPALEPAEDSKHDHT